MVLGNLTYRFIGLKSMEKTSESIVQAIQELICLSYELKVQQMTRSKAAPGAFLCVRLPQVHLYRLGCPGEL